jgi:sugar phosphate isomerase/epimerase
LEHEDICSIVRELGYEGLEIAPFTLAARITEVSKERRRELKAIAEERGLRIIGLHWLLAKTEGFHLNSPDETVRSRTAEYLGELARCCRDLGGDLLVFGSPAQRLKPAGAAGQQAAKWAVDTFRRATPAIADSGVRLCLEPLPPKETDFINTIDEALDLLREISHPSFMLHLDVKAMGSESAPTPELVRRHAGQATHFHANDATGKGPGAGPTDFIPIFQALKDGGYAGWISVEVFDYTPDPITIARQSISYMKLCEAAADSQRQAQK